MKIPATRTIKWLYCLAIVSVIFTSKLLEPGAWIILMASGGISGMMLFIGPILLLAFIIYRVYSVARYSHTLDAYITSGSVRALRTISIAAMFVGGVALFGTFIVKEIALLIFGRAFYIPGLFLYVISNAGLIGWLLFELSRLLGFEAMVAEDRGS